MRNVSLQFLLEALYHRIQLNEETYIPIVKQPQITDKTPCITLDNQNNNLQSIYYSYKPKEYLNKRFDSTTVINIWCNTEKERQNIINQIDDCFNAIINDHYLYCTKYKEGQCISLGTKCKAPDDTSGRGCKHQCPKPYEYGYENLFTKYQVNPNTFGFNQGIDNDEYDKKDVLLRTMITVTFEYVISYCNDGKVSTKLTYQGD